VPDDAPAQTFGMDRAAEPAPRVAAEPAVLPDAVRQRVLALANETLSQLPFEEIPAKLRVAAKFTSAKRWKLAASALAVALEAESLFRLRVAEAAEAAQPAVAEAVRRAETPAAADPVELATLAYLLRPDGWPGYLERADHVLAERAERSRSAERDELVTKLQTQLDEAREALHEHAERAVADLARARADAEGLRKHIRQLTGQMRAAERSAVAAGEELAAERRRADAAEAAAQAEIRRLKAKLAESESAMEGAKRVARGNRGAEDARLWLLLDTVTGAVQGLRRELALTPTDERPADLMEQPTTSGAAASGVLPPTDDPALLDRLLELPHVHLVVDGYNVTKTGYGDLTLEAQRRRLTKGLAALAARTGAEVTCVWDGAERPPAMPTQPRGVRVLFSPPGQIADVMIRRLVANEPDGRPVVVVSTDKEVAGGVRRSGAYAIPAASLLARLDRV
jgi:predicted RNA-binding protein with PIN domain